MTVNVWVIILNWNGWRDTIECLRSLANITDPKVRILVVDNGSEDDSVAQLKAYSMQPSAPRFEVFETGRNLGYGGGNNAGMKKALNESAEWILMLNNDTTVEPNFLHTLLDAAASDEKIGILNPKILLAEKTDHIWFVGGELNWMRTKGWHVGYGEKDAGRYDESPVRDTEYATGGCLLVRRKTIEAIGLLPEPYFVYYEDVEWSLRAQKAGWRCVVVPKARVWHKGAASSKEFSPSYIRYHVRNGLLLSRRMGTLPQALVAYTVSIPRALWQLPKLLGTSTQQRWGKAVLFGIRDAWLGRTGKISD